MNTNILSTKHALLTPKQLSYKLLFNNTLIIDIEDRIRKFNMAAYDVY